MNSNFPLHGSTTHTRQRHFLAAGLFALAVPMALAQTAVRIDLTKPGLPVSPTLYG